ALPDLPDALAGDTEQGADLLQRQRLGAFFQTVVERENLAFAGGEVTFEDAVDEFALQPGVGHLLDLNASRAGDSFTEGAGAAVLSLHWGIQRHLGGGHPPRRPDIIDRVVERGSD